MQQASKRQTERLMSHHACKVQTPVLACHVLSESTWDLMLKKDKNEVQIPNQSLGCHAFGTYLSVHWDTAGVLLNSRDRCVST